MDTNKIVARAKSTLLTPKTEWPVIAAEPATVAQLYSGYILIMAAIPAVVFFLSAAVIGIHVPFLGLYRIGAGTALTSALTSYVLGLVGVYVVALIVDALAPSFDGQRNQIQALKTVAYAYTASWVASIVGIIPGLTLLAAIVGLIYGIYLLRLGLPFTMKCPDDKATGYTAVTIIVAIITALVLNFTARALLPTPIYGGISTSAMSHSGEGFEPGSTGAALEKWAKNLQAASAKMDAAQKSGDTNAQANAVGQMVGAALGNDGKVESLPPDRIKAFAPDSLGGLSRTSLSAQRNAAMGVQISKASAQYSDGAQRNLNLEITDTGSLRGLVGFAAGWAGVEQDQETDTGYEKIYKTGGQLVHEQWDKRSHHGQYAVVVGDRFAVALSGEVADISELKTALGSVDLAGLAALKGVGVEAN
ncbi:MAG: YIP1 family protein [Sinobacteraceae bacterium]|nr:YIP1 family protein [Nevskiaceae bacterium]